jgi:hypothetical protein
VPVACSKRTSGYFFASLTTHAWKPKDVEKMILLPSLIRLSIT